MMEAALLIQLGENRPYPHGQAKRCRDGPGLGGLFFGIVLLCLPVLVLRAARLSMLKREHEVRDKKELLDKKEPLDREEELLQRQQILQRPPRVRQAIADNLRQTAALKLRDTEQDQ